jgi:hypothetical protein
MQELSIISYDLKKCTRTERSSIQRAINGYVDYSFNQKYKYKRKGLIEEIPNLYLNNGVIIVLSKDASKITSILKKHKAKVKVINLYSKSLLLH